MARKDGTLPATVALSHQNRDKLKSLTVVIGFLIGKPVTYGEAIAEAERIVRETASDPELRERFALTPKPDHIVIHESVSA